MHSHCVTIVTKIILKFKLLNFYRELFGLRAAQFNQQVVVTGGLVSQDGEPRKEVLCGVVLIPDSSKPVRDAFREKKRYYVGKIPKRQTLTPPVWERPVTKKEEVLFCILGPKEHF